MSYLGPYLKTPPLNITPPKAGFPPPVLKPPPGGPGQYAFKTAKLKTVSLARVFQTIAGWSF